MEWHWATAIVFSRPPVLFFPIYICTSTQGFSGLLWYINCPQFWGVTSTSFHRKLNYITKSPLKPFKSMMLSSFHFFHSFKFHFLCFFWTDPSLNWGEMEGNFYTKSTWQPLWKFSKRMTSFEMFSFVLMTPLRDWRQSCKLIWWCKHTH